MVRASSTSSTSFTPSTSLSTSASGPLLVLPFTSSIRSSTQCLQSQSVNRTPLGHRLPCSSFVNHIANASSDTDAFVLTWSTVTALIISQMTRHTHIHVFTHTSTNGKSRGEDCGCVKWCGVKHDLGSREEMVFAGFD